MTNRVQNEAARLGEESIGKLLWRFSLPATLASAVNASYNIIDTIFVGGLGSDAIAALSIALPMQMVMGAIGIGTGVGAASLISRSLGAKKEEDANTAGGQVLILALFVGLLSTLIGRLYLEELLVFFGATEEIIDLARSYMAVIIDGAVMLYLMWIMNNIIRAQGNAVIPMIAMIASALTNIILDPIFIYSFEMGVSGAALATVIAKIVGVAIELQYLLRNKGIIKINLQHFKPSFRIIKEIYRVGLPSMLMHIANDTSIIVANRVLRSYGYVPIAVRGLTQRLQMFAIMPARGISQGLVPIIGYNFGAQKYDRVREAMLKACAIGACFTTAAGIAYFVAPGFFLSIFNSDPELLAIGVKAVRIVVVMYPLMGIQAISTTFFQAIGNGVPALFLSLLRRLILYMPLVLLLPSIFDLNGIWLAAPISDFLAFAITLYLVAREFKKYDIPLLRKAEKILPQPQSDES
ncbi:MAG: MATE family efflux transporter [Firmicutes bacterium]|nr:MATE family efflux transporter [Bacillota bacterium]